MITSKMKRRMKRKFSSESPTVWVGKEGSTAQIVNEISRQLEQHEVVKGRILQAALKDEGAKEIAARIAKQTESTLVEVRGHTFILYRRKKKAQPPTTTAKPFRSKH
jgi:RNA-binding protein